MIDQTTIDRIFDAADIVDVISDFVQLKRRGTNYLGLCPFHNEKTPSFNVSQSKGIYKCFGCGKGGNVVSFIMEHEHMSYPEALKYIANKYGIPVHEETVSEEEIQKKDNRESMMIVNEFARKYFRKQLTESDRGRAIGLSYFRERGFTDQIIDKFDLGYCPEGKDVFTTEALGKGYKIEFLESTGLTIVKDNWQVDRFSGRVMFPIHSVAGRVIGFGGRTLSQEKKIAKYLNSPESDVYHKSKILYGIFQAKRKIVQDDNCYLVEGYTDVISLHKSGIENVVASSGTSLTEDQIRLIKRFTSNVTILYDGDAAGIKASLRGIDMLLEQDMNVRVVLFPDGEDPDSFAKANSPEALLNFIETQKEDFIHFKTKLLVEDAKNDPIKRSELISSIIRSIGVIENQIKQSVYIKSCSKLLDIGEDVLYAELQKIRKKRFEEQQRKDRQQSLHKTENVIPAVPSHVSNVYMEEHEKEIIRILILYGNSVISQDDNGNKTRVAEFIINEIRNDELEFENLVYNALFETADEFIREGKPFDKLIFINSSDKRIAKVTAELLSNKYNLDPFWEKRGTHIESEEDKLEQLVPNLIIQYKRKILEKALEEKSKEIQKVDESVDSIDKIMQLLSEMKDISKTIGRLAALNGMVILK
jgi:DNA primase